MRCKDFCEACERYLGKEVVIALDHCNTIHYVKGTLIKDNARYYLLHNNVLFEGAPPRDKSIPSQYKLSWYLIRAYPPYFKDVSLFLKDPCCITLYDTPSICLGNINELL